MERALTHRKEIPRSSWVWDISSSELSLGFTFLRLFGEDADYVPSSFKKDIIKDFGTTDIDNDVPFYRKTQHIIHDKRYYVEWIGEAIEKSKDGKITKMAGFAELGSSPDDFTLSVNEEALFFTRLMDNIKESVYFKDLESRFIKVNNACAQKFGLNDPSEMIGKTEFDFFEEAHARETYNDEREIIKTKTPLFNKVAKEIFLNDPNNIKCASISKLPLYDEKGVLIGTYGITRDITEETVVKEMLKKSNELFDKLSERIPGLFFQYEFNEGGVSRFPFASKGIRDIYELEPEDV